MIGGRTVITLLIAAATGVGAYTATVKTRPASAPAAQTDPATEALLNWLGASPSQREALRRQGGGFAAELRQLKADLAARRSEYIAALERADASNEEIMARLEAVLAANNELERRVAHYLLSVREHLTPEQQRRLLGLCAEGARRGRQWRGGRDGGPDHPAPHHGQGGRGWRGGRGPDGG
ncbi:MAG TPA: periplasmic heavy metal sensor [Phycisphaerae bacterium]|jgi:Spy/CpxP family protein refolding chaperone|nr:periplasmic heavy metal sensor [Phycisphaerae bacterium]HOB74331.1 periplasmic heavy metal sensor [Phycisphaerae bacterium]HOJ53078.1 periplasmic heavy metal sensor [Phycisphaerae bacterium]HOL24815.1 periplasmic heavy metal sensor [Phycisphaerae bacterium]HPP19351.1 periplasmic heavy metal sensor [Phycisphaerae bacterium]